ncbi:hypothetical protein CDO73_00040 [Saccharibacillus sp. O23]|uniref:DUF7408 domain-containing protein n=1 Tax=Saccharibacillus sp. O23 TaxID=2009338 RepID=UPI000B4E2039|nr:hypothetical protein [Saccharibacillus sp. O23]OWR32945.1 hypothetical protein CDO73_00040 [Saccharibacillus sp. O23]
MFAWVKRRTGSGMALLLSILLAASLLSVLPARADAAGKSSDDAGLRVSTELGYGGKVNEGRWTPLRVTLTSDQDLSGDLVVQLQPQNGMGESTYVRRVELPAGTAKEVTFAVAGSSYSRTTSLIRFYPGSAEKGKSLEFKEGRAYVSSSSQFGGIVGVLASDPDTMNFLSLVQASGTSVSVVPLEAKDIGSDPMLLEGLDVLVINDFASDTLNEAQLKAIRDWVARGGTLVFGGGAGYAKSSAGLEDLSPVEASGGTVSVPAAPLAVGTGEPLQAGAALTVAQAQLKKEAAASYLSGNRPLIASMPVQAGRVWYAGYDLALEPAASWAGNSSLWGKLLREKLNANANTGGMAAASSAFNSNFYNLSYTLDFFPSLHMPKMSLLVWMLLIYVVVVAPLLYLLLRKFDKREWAWVFIPLIAVVSSGAIYLAGSSDKTSEIAHTLSYVTLDGEGEGVRRSATALFVPRAGDYKVAFPAGTRLSMIGTDNWMGGYNGEVSGRLTHFVREEADKSELRLGDMSYWSVSKFSVEEPGNQETGKLETSLTVDDKGQVVGEVVNATGSRLDDAAVIAGGKLYKLGTLEPDGKATLGKGAALSTGYYDLGSYLFPVQTSNADPYIRQRSMLQNTPASGALNSGMQNAYLIAFAEDTNDKLNVGGKSVKNDRLSLYTQPVSIGLPTNGEIDIPYGYIGGRVIHTNTTQVNDDGMGRIGASPGSMTLGYTLPDLGQAKYEKLDIRISGGVPKTISVEIMNEKSGEWEAVNWKGGAASLNQASDYLVDGNQVQLRIRVNEWTSMPLPEIGLKGAVQP